MNEYIAPREHDIGFGRAGFPNHSALIVHDLFRRTAPLILLDRDEAHSVTAYQYVTNIALTALANFCFCYSTFICAHVDLAK